MQSDTSHKIYTNDGNAAVVSLIDRNARDVLDVGCGTGGTATLLRTRDPHKRLYGITGSSAEAELARPRFEHCWVADLEGQLPASLLEHRFDVVICAHVLEHLRQPQHVLRQLVQLLRPGGQCVVAIPNVVSWRQRWQFFRGRFEYQADGVMDATHLRFYSYWTAVPELCSGIPDLCVEHLRVTGSVPLWLLRRHVLPTAWAARLDDAGCRTWPNLFGNEILIDCKKKIQS